MQAVSATLERVVGWSLWSAWSAVHGIVVVRCEPNADVCALVLALARTADMEARYGGPQVPTERLLRPMVWSGGKRGALWATPPRSVDAPFVELQERQSTAVLPMSKGAPPAASGVT